VSAEPPQDCARCERLVAFRHEAQAAHPDWFNAPVPTFTAAEPRLLIVGLAPGLRGANRTGRPFTGDFAGNLLYETLLAYGFATGTYAECIDDGLQLNGCAITNAVRCVPLQNKPLPSEIANCRSYLSATIASFPRLEAILALGRIAHESVLRAFGLKLSEFPFAHGGEHQFSTRESASLALFDSYHCSRYNTNTGKLTEQMFHQVFDSIRARLEFSLRPLDRP
jgi:uracil-DNA glycosylase family 4